MINLVISDPEGTTTVVPFARDEITIGRKEGNTIRLTERNISREHCRLQRVNGGFSIQDLGSYNGVIINGERIDGESPVKPGDQLQIGDYSVKLEGEAPASTSDTKTVEIPVEQVRERVDSVEEDEPTRVAPIPRPTPPARLVVLSPPLAGAEFSLPERGDVRMGRDQGLEIPLDHRSVSRVHAKIACEGEQFRIIDQGSVNGVTVNGEKVSDARLVAGDVVELGDVALRFVGGNEPYVFDPAETRTFVAHKRGRQRRGQYIAVAAVSAALVVAYLLFAPAEPSGSTDAAAHVQPATAPSAAVPSAAPQAEPQAEAQAEPQAAATDDFSKFLASCREANAGGRFAEAMAHANAALKARPAAPEAIDCERLARVNDEQEQIFVRGKAALAAGDAKAAWSELSQLSPTGARRLQPDVVEVVEAVASKRLDGAEVELRARPTAAIKLAQSVLALEPLSSALRARAQSIIDREHAAATAPAPRSEPVARRAPEPAARRAPEARPAARPAAQDKPAMEVATECLARGDNPCVIRALAGKARTAQELGLLIETYLAVGDSAQADRNITTYLARFPTARRADAYRAMRQR